MPERVETAGIRERHVGNSVRTAHGRDHGCVGAAATQPVFDNTGDRSARHGRSGRENELDGFLARVAEEVTQPWLDDDAIHAIRSPAAVDVDADFRTAAVYTQCAIERRDDDERLRKAALAESLVEAEHHGP